MLHIQYLELLLACPGVTDHTHMTELNQVVVFIYALPQAKNHVQNLAHSWDKVDLIFRITFVMHRHLWPHPQPVKMNG